MLDALSRWESYIENDPVLGERNSRGRRERGPGVIGRDVPLSVSAAPGVHSSSRPSVYPRLAGPRGTTEPHRRVRCAT